MLDQILSRYRAWLLTEDDWVMKLFKNDFTPTPGTVVGDYTEATYPGYLPGTIVNADWLPVAVAAHVASITNSTKTEFFANNAGFVSQVIYGYWVEDDSGTYQYGERFALPKTIEPGDELDVTAVLKLATYPNP